MAKMHQTESGAWVRCEATVRACPRNHINVEGGDTAAASFLNEVVAQQKGVPVSALKAKRPPLPAANKAVNKVLSTLYGARGREAREALGARVVGILDTTSDKQAAYQQVRAEVAKAYFAPEGSYTPANAARRILLERGYVVTGDVRGNAPTIVEAKSLYPQFAEPTQVAAGDILYYNGGRFEVTKVDYAPAFATDAPGNGGKPYRFYVNPAFTDPGAPADARPRAIEADRDMYTVLRTDEQQRAFEAQTAAA